MRGERVVKTCGSCATSFTDYVSNSRSGFCSLPCYWESKKGSQGYWSGKKRSYEDRKKMSENRKGLTAKENHPKWKGGISSEYTSIRNSFEYKEWRRAVFIRDRWTCILCGYRSKGKIKGQKRSDIEADHIKRFSEYPELRFAIDNGRTLCKPCHIKITFNSI